MILNHIWGLYTAPKKEWQTIEKRHESLTYSMVHILTIALIPAICGYYAAAHIGWSIGAGDPIKLTESCDVYVNRHVFRPNFRRSFASSFDSMDGKNL